MKKNIKAIAALMAAVITITASPNIIAFAGVDGENRETLEETLKGNGYPYTKIEDASGIDVQEYSQKDGSVYYVNEIGQVMAVKTVQPDCISIVMYEATDETKLNETIAEVLPDANVEKGIGYNTEGEKIVEIEISPQTGDELSLAQAKLLFSIVKEDVIGFVYSSAMYSIGHPQYCWTLNNEGIKRHHFTYYRNCSEKKEELQAIINENNWKCHIEENDNDLDVVTDISISYLEEIEIASKITNATGLKCTWSIADSLGEQISGAKVDIYNSLQGDANCDNNLDLADAIYIMQTLANPNKYMISEQGRFNADMDGDGLTVGDAQAIQMKLLGLGEKE